MFPSFVNKDHKVGGLVAATCVALEDLQSFSFLSVSVGLMALASIITSFKTAEGVFLTFTDLDHLWQGGQGRQHTGA